VVELDELLDVVLEELADELEELLDELDELLLVIGAEVLLTELVELGPHENDKVVDL